MAERIQGPTKVSVPTLSPRAAPIPILEEGSAGLKEAQLAEAFREFIPSLQRAGQGLQEKKDVKTIEQARNQAQDDRAAGIISNHQDPFYRFHYNRVRSQDLAYKLHAEWEIASKSILEGATTLEEYDAAEEAFLEEKYEEIFGEAPGELDQFLLRETDESLNVLLRNRRLQFAQEAAERLKQAGDEAFYGVTRGGLRAALAGGGSQEDLTDLMQTNLAEHVANDATPGERRLSNTALTNAATDLAIELAQNGQMLEAQTVLSALEGVTLEDGKTQLVGTRVLQAKLRETRNQMGQAYRSWEATEEAVAQQELQGLQTELTDALLENPNADLRQFYQRANRMGLNADSVTRFIDFNESNKNRLQSSTARTPESVMNDYRMRIMQEGNPQKRLDIVMEYGQRADANGTDFNTLLQATRSAETIASQRALFETQTYSRARNETIRRFDSDDTTNEVANEIRQAVENAYWLEWVAWRESNPNATEAEQRVFLQELGNSLERQYGAQFDGAWDGGASQKGEVYDTSRWHTEDLLNEGIERLLLLRAEGVFNDPDAQYRMFLPGDLERIERTIGFNPVTADESVIDRFVAAQEARKKNNDNQN